jgi:hypothetical protein
MYEADWNHRELDLEGLSCSETTSTTVWIPGEAMSDGVPVISTVRMVNSELTGTPTQIGCRFFGRRAECANLTKYKTDKEVWYLSDKLILLNGKVAFIVLPPIPTRQRKAIVGVNLMSCCSPMAKMLKEKVIPNLVRDNGVEMKILNTWNWRLTQTGIHGDLEKDTTEIMLKHLDELCR